MFACCIKNPDPAGSQVVVSVKGPTTQSTLVPPVLITAEPPLATWEPGLVTAVTESEDVLVEFKGHAVPEYVYLIGDHVNPHQL